MKYACIFCASSPKVPQVYFDASRKLAQFLVESGWGVVYGGGSVGLMGAIADEVLRLDGEIIGVIPQFMVEVEWQHEGVADMRQTDTMSERKRMMIELSDVVVVLPGSTGTMDEFFEALSDRKLGLIDKRIILLNTNNFFDGTITQLQRMVEEQFLSDHHIEVLDIAATPEQVLDFCAARSAAKIESLLDAAVK